MKNSISLFFTVTLSLLLFSACEEDYQSVYSYGIFEFSESSADGGGLVIVTDYLREVDCFSGMMIFESSSLVENEVKAIRYFDVNAEKIDEEALGALLGNRNVEFTYGLAGGYTDPSVTDYLKKVTFKFGSFAEE